MSSLFSSEISLLSTSAVPSPNPVQPKSGVVDFVPAVLFSKWPVKYATTSLLCDFLSSWSRPLHSTLPCDSFRSYLKHDNASAADDFYKINILFGCSVFFWFLRGRPVSATYPVIGAACRINYCRFTPPNKRPYSRRTLQNQTSNEKLNELICRRDRHLPQLLSVASLNLNLVRLNAHPLFACLYSSLYWVYYFYIFILVSKARLIYVVDLGSVLYIYIMCKYIYKYIRVKSICIA